MYRLNPGRRRIEELSSSQSPVLDRFHLGADMHQALRAVARLHGTSLRRQPPTDPQCGEAPPARPSRTGSGKAALRAAGGKVSTGHCPPEAERFPRWLSTGPCGAEVRVHIQILGARHAPARKAQWTVVCMLLCPPAHPGGAASALEAPAQAALLSGAHRRPPCPTPCFCLVCQPPARRPLPQRPVQAAGTERGAGHTQ